MNFRPNAEDNRYRDRMRALADSYGWPEMKAIRDELDEMAIERYSFSFQRRLAEEGLIGLTWPEPYGREARVDQQPQTRPAVVVFLLDELEIGRPTAKASRQLLFEHANDVAVLELGSADVHTDQQRPTRNPIECDCRTGGLRNRPGTDLDNLAAEAGNTSYGGAPDGLRIGHIHLRVGDLGVTQQFYCDTVGLNPTAGRGGALFMSSGRYHHHVGSNIWHSAGAGQRDEDRAGLSWFSIEAADDAERDAAIARLKAAQAPIAGGSRLLLLRCFHGTKPQTYRVGAVLRRLEPDSVSKATRAPATRAADLLSEM